MNQFAPWLLFALGIFSQTAGSTFGSETDLLRARAAAAIAIHNAAVEPEITSPALAVSPKVSARPVVTMYSATWCVPCQRAKVELNAAKLPFELRVADVSDGGQPDWCESIPAFAWEAKGRTRYVLGFPGVAQLIASWQATQ